MNEQPIRSPSGDSAGASEGGNTSLNPSASTSVEWLPTQQQQQVALGIDTSVADHGRSAMERNTLRPAYRSSNSNGNVTIRAVTPEMGDFSDSGVDRMVDVSYASRGLASQETSPRSIPGGSSRRQGMVFNDSLIDPCESAESSPPQNASRLSNNTIRPRTRTMDTAMLAGQRAAHPAVEQRHRVGSVSSSGSQAVSEDLRQPAAGLESTGFPTIMATRAPDVPAPTSAPPVPKSDKKSSKRLVKRQSSRPTSPHVAPPPSIDSLPFPIPTESPHRMVLLMKALCGKMRGEIEYQGESGGTWYTGISYIDEERGCLMFDSGQHGPFHIPLVADLRGCRVLPVDYPEADKRCLELVSSNPVIEVLLHPLVPEEFDFWLAALLSWQQLRPAALKLTPHKALTPLGPVRPELVRRGISDGNQKSNSIIKVGKVLIWDKGQAPGPKTLMRRSSTRDARSLQPSWKRVSCILHDNGEFKLMAENDVAILAVIDLAQLCRHAIQQLDRTVLEEEYCIAIFPTYANTASQLTVLSPLYMALDNRIHFEVWFALLRAFAVPEVYKVDHPDEERIGFVEDVEKDINGEVFRVEKTISVRVTEAKLKAKSLDPDMAVGERPTRSAEGESLVGNYLAEVMLNGEVRARTAIKTATKSPFWREDCEFQDLSPGTPQLSVVLKRVEGMTESSGHNSPSGSVVFKAGTNTNGVEVACGTVKIPLPQSATGPREQEEWLQILDDNNESLGTMLVRVVFDEHIILLAKEYQPLADVLHNFNAGLTSGISTALPGQLKRLAELFLNIFQVSEKASEWLMSLVEDEIDGIGSQGTLKKYRFNSRLKSNESVESTSDRELILRDMSKSLTGEANLLFRGNTLLTQALELHMRRLGKEFLEETLQEKLYQINELNPDCEVDPSRLTPGSTELEAHWNRLIDITTEVWQCITASATKLNPELRGILKYVRAVAEDRYGDFLRSVAYTSVSGFLFLRFICPAILSPKLFGLLRDHPRPRAQRTFTLIAKALQKLANLSNFGRREEWMEPMNRFLNVQRSVFRDYIDQICDIPADRATRTLHASYSTPVTILSRLSPGAREGFPSLPFLIDQSRNYASLVKLWVDLKPTDNKKITIEGDLLVFGELCEVLQQRADSCLAKHKSMRLTEAEESNAAVDEMADILERASLIESLAYAYPGNTVWNELDERPGSSGSEATEDAGGRRSKDLRRGRDMLDSKKAGSSRHVSGSTGHTLKSKNGKKGPGTGRTILSGIMRIGQRAESPESKDKR